MVPVLRSFLLALLCAGPLPGAFLVEVDIDGADDGVVTPPPGFSFGGDTTTAFQSGSAGAFGLTGGDSIFGGNGVSQPDTYVFTYSPDLQADNLFLEAGTPLGNGHVASGAAGGAAGRYAVYACWPETTNVGGGPTTYTVSTTGDSVALAVEQNGGGNAWVKIGEVEWTSGPITVTQTAGTNAFVSMRAAGVLFERLDDGGQTGYTGPPGPVVFGEGVNRFFGIAFRRPRTEAAGTHFAVVEGSDLTNWSTSDLKLVSVVPDGPDHDLVTFRSMRPMGETPGRFLAVREIPKMPVGPAPVAITFDDGPHPTRTAELLDLLAARNIRATFYVTGTNAGFHPHLIRRMLNEGHELGNHTMSHPRLTDLTLEEVRAEMDGCRDAIVAAATAAPPTMRPPYGAVNQTLRDLFLSEYGYPTVLWDVDPRDWDSAVSDQQVVDTVLTETDAGEIVLFHDIHQRTIDLMPALLDELLARGFSFVTVTELLELNAP